MAGMAELEKMSDGSLPVDGTVSVARTEGLYGSLRSMNSLGMQGTALKFRVGSDQDLTAHADMHTRT